jgi:signal transduction histidine kinase
MINNFINTCFATTETLRDIAGYSHLIPAVLSLLLGTFIFVKAKYNLFSRVFLSFVIFFALWLIGDVIIWNSNNYNLVHSIWSMLDFIEIIFYVLSLYFVLVFIYEKDISKSIKFLFLVSILPAFYLTFNSLSVINFYHAVCESTNNGFLTNYKLVLESAIGLILLFYIIKTFFNKTMDRLDRRADLIVLSSILLFLTVFGATEYISSYTGIYEINLYSLFILPVFLLAIIYAVFELDIFKFKILGTHYMVVGLVIFVLGQLFFVRNTGSLVMTLITLLFAIGISILIFANYRRESLQRVRIEKLNTELESLLKQRESLVHLITHKVKASFTRSKYIFAEMAGGGFGPLSEELTHMAKTGLNSDNEGIKTIDLVLNAVNLEKGIVKYDMQKFDFKALVLDSALSRRDPAEAKGLKMIMNIEDGEFNILGDQFWLREVTNNLIENSVRYTESGNIEINLKRKENKLLFSVRDSGVGITPEDKKNLFQAGGRGKDSVKVNVDSTGYGLYSVRLIVEAHQGKVWADSEGAGKGSTFSVELDLA